jgi:sulfatase modifying factor 1
VTTPRRNLRSRSLPPVVGFALASLGLASFGGCFVSFDGYELADAGGTPSGSSGNGGDASGGSAGSESVTGGGGQMSVGGTSPIAGTSSGGATGRAGSSGVSGSSSSSGNSGIGGGGSGGTATGGNPSGGDGGTPAGGTSAGGSSTGGGGASGVAGSGGAPLNCPIANIHGSVLVEIPRPGGGIYCIDRTEVTNSDYASFLASNPSISVQSQACTGNSTFAPDTTGECTQYDPTNKPKVPVSCVNWCDAEAFCTWAGKHLCGKIGGGTNAPASFADATKSEWYAACSHAGQYQFPYGATNNDTYDGGACIGGDSTAIRPTAVPTTSCQGGYDGLFDMSGNVSEWEDSCTGNTGLTDQCLYRGGSYLDFNTTEGTAPSLQCNSGNGATAKSVSKARSTRDKEIGFRCCLDP